MLCLLTLENSIAFNATIHKDKVIQKYYLAVQRESCTVPIKASTVSKSNSHCNPMPCLEEISVEMHHEQTAATI